jgi:hypothetical protein
LPIAPEIVAQRLLQRLCDLGLVDIKGKKKWNGAQLRRPFPTLPRVDQSFIVTRLGHEAIEDRSVFMPERQSGRILYIQDFLYPDHILSFEAKEESLHQTIQQSKTNQDSHDTEFRQSERLRLDEWLYDIEGRKINLFEGSEGYTGTVRIDRIHPFMRIPLNDFQKLRVELILEQYHEMSLELEFNGKVHKLPTTHINKIGVTYEKVLFDLLQNNDLKWNSEVSAVPVKFDKSLTEKERKSFRKDFTINNPDLPFLGPFDTFTLKEVPICPSTRKDASAWYNYLLRESISSYVTKKEFTSISYEALIPFEMWENDIEIPSILTLINEEENKRKDGTNDPVYWFLRAPIDLAGAGGD